MNRPIIAITAGDVAGIGPEVTARALCCPTVRSVCQPLVLCHPQILQRAIQPNRLSMQVVELNSVPKDQKELVARDDSDSVLCLNPAGDGALQAASGTVSAAGGDAAFQYLQTAIRLTQAGITDAICTAPLNKAALHAAGHNFPGHTEILADACGVSDFAMMLHLPAARLAPFRALVANASDHPSDHSNGLSVVHVTLHTSLESVPNLVTRDGIVEKARLLDEFLQRINCRRRAIAVSALNPHGGEGGLFGQQESHMIEPAIRDCGDLPVTGPVPVDTLFRRAVAGEFDGVVVMYHDQGHIPIKLLGFDAAINITLGLPLIRTSPTHGTAFDRAWNPATPADPSGMIEAVLMAARMCAGKSTPS